ncbi:MAG: PilZ domain-containing protein [Acidobacteriia bacterium]|nr:PilZ domain-containing protein [Terriglobia bacterium]
MTADPNRKRQNIRRSQRLPLHIPIHIECFVEKRGRFAADTVTVVISPHGALVRLPWDVPLNQELQLQNPSSLESQNATVAFVHPLGDGNFDVGVDFNRPNPGFWGVTFPPDDWSPNHPDAKKDL